MHSNKINKIIYILSLHQKKAESYNILYIIKNIFITLKKEVYFADWFMEQKSALFVGQVIVPNVLVDVTVEAPPDRHVKFYPSP